MCKFYAFLFLAGNHNYNYMLLLHILFFSTSALCPMEGQVFHLTCPSSCPQTCDSLGKLLECSDECNPGCYCPAGKVSTNIASAEALLLYTSYYVFLIVQVLDKVNNKCVQPSECPCPACDPLPENCTDIVQPPSSERCGCPKCRSMCSTIQ